MTAGSKLRCPEQTMPRRLLSAIEKPHFFWRVALGFFALAVAGLAFMAIQADRTATIRDAEARVQSLAEILEEHAERALAEGEKLFVAVRPLVKAWDLKDPVLGERIYEEMRAFLLGSPQLGSAWILDDKGTTVLGTWDFPTPPVDASSRDYFKAHKAGAQEPFLGRQEIGRIAGKPRFTISRAVRDADGQIHAIIVVAVYSDYFEALYRSAASWPGATAGLFLARGGQFDVLAQMSGVNATLGDLRNSLLELSQSQPSGVRILQLASGPRVVGWSDSRDIPGMFAATSQSISAALREWIWRSAVTGGAAALSVLFFALLGVFGSRAEETERQLERQKLLMREVHHRVKNSLAIIAAITNAAARQCGSDTAAREQFKKLGSQIMSIATLYDLMQQAPGAGLVELNGMLHSLCLRLSESTGRQIEFLPDKPVMIDVDQAVSLMIIVNELVTNSIKHSTGPIKVVATGDPSEISIRVDNTTGELPPDFDAGPDHGFGLSMARALASSLKGSVDIVSRAPPSVALTFPRPAPEQEPSG
jgi:two-component sensor histidine kinase